VGDNPYNLMIFPLPTPNFNDLSLYIHLPFCARRCPYCDFPAQPFSAPLARPLLEALRRHLSRLPDMHPVSGRRLDSVYVGGGTPSLWPAASLSLLLAEIKKHFPLPGEAEVSLEANPDTLSPGKLLKLRRAGFNRLSLGVQSFAPDSLRILGRSHRPGHISKAVQWARQAGFANLSLDIMYGLPGQNSAMALEDIRHLLALRPDHVSLYQLTLNPNTPMGRQYRPYHAPMPDEDLVLAMEKQSYQLCEKAGLERYEISNFARPGFQCRHNASAWRGGDYLAVGPGAHGHLNGRRWANYTDVAAYIKAWNPDGGEGVEFCEDLSVGQRVLELFMLGLRTSQGVNLDAISRLSGQAAQQNYRKALTRVQALGWARISYPYLKPTPSGMRMADQAALLFFPDAE
jgi:oxygen-independent coproporphyrinogen-3 oxidase